MILPNLEPWEEEYHNMTEEIENYQREWLCDQLGKAKALEIPEKEPTVEEIIESLPFKPASRVTEADLADDKRSLERKLSQSLFLVVKRNRGEFEWQFPQGKLQSTETLRPSAERVLDRAVGKIRRWFVSNAPMGHYCYAYPEEVQKKRQQYGAKVFFYRAQLIAGNIKLETKLYKDFAWISRYQMNSLDMTYCIPYP